MIADWHTDTVLELNHPWRSIDKNCKLIKITSGFEVISTTERYLQFRSHKNHFLYSRRGSLGMRIVMVADHVKSIVYIQDSFYEQFKMTTTIIRGDWSVKKYTTLIQPKEFFDKIQLSLPLP